MKKSVKALLTALCAIVLVVATVLGTLAYMTDRSTVTNTFTVGNVNITVDEAKVTEYGEPVADAERVGENTYKLIPGKTYVKDPTMTVKAGSEESYVRMIVTMTCAKELDDIFAPGVTLDKIFGGYNSAVWEYVGATNDFEKNTVAHEFRYKTTVKPVDANTDLVLDPLFTNIQVPGTLTSEQLNKLTGFKIDVEGHAIQAATFGNAADAWTAFAAQYESANS